MDGLRGAAAATVVMSHLLLFSVPSLAAGFKATTPPAGLGVVPWLLLYTPLHVIWAGQEAVIVFFVLSGYVLTLPVVTSGRVFELLYFPRRLVRLYLPVWGALLVAFGLNHAVRRAMVNDATWVLNGEIGRATAAMWGHAAALVTAQSAPQQLDPVIWSLRWEVIFSMALPAFVLVARSSRRRPGLAVLYGLACLGVTGIGARTGNAGLRYLPVFLIGSLIAYHRDPLVAGVSALVRRGRVGVPGLLSVLALSLLTAGWWIRPHGWALPYLPQETRVSAALSALVAVGAALMVLLAMSLRGWRHVLTSPAARWGGSRSYSLYLVHLPFVTTLAFAWGGRPPAVLYIPAGLAGSLVLTEVFFRVVEHPSHQLSRRIVRRRRTPSHAAA